MPAVIAALHSVSICVWPGATRYHGHGVELMGVSPKKHIRPLVTRGNSLCAHIPRDLLARLGWNRYDNIVYEIVEGALILTKVKLPTVEHLRKATAGEAHGG